MAEGRRFLLALTLVGTCMAIAGVFVASAPPVAWPAVPGLEPREAGVGALPRQPLPPWRDVPAPRPEAPAPRRAAATPVRAVASTPMTPVIAPIAAVGDVSLAEPSLPAPALAPPPLAAETPLPGPAGADRPAADPTAAHRIARRDRDPVTGVFVTAGAHVGKGFRTVGRTLRNLF